MAGEYAYVLEDVTKQHNTKTILDGINLAFFFGARIGVIGANGSGKTSLLRIMAGIDKDFVGLAQIAPNRTIGYLEQEPPLDDSKTVQEVVAEGVAVLQAKLDRYDELCGLMGEELTPEETEKLNDEYDLLQNEIDALDLWELDHQVDMAMDALRLPEGDSPVNILSGGEKRRVALCRLLLQNPDVLLLDEPTNHLDTESVAWIEEHLKRFKGTLIVVTHDRYFLSNVTDWILELDGGRAYPYKGNYEAWLEQKQVLASQQSKQNASRRKLLERELEWVRMNASSRLTKNKARLKRYDELASQEFDASEDKLVIQIPHGRRLGDLVVRAAGLTKVYGERVIMQDVDFNLPPGGIVGVIGGNGAGKTTLFKMITGQEEATSGSLQIGDSVDVAYVDQFRDDLDPDKTVFEEISGGMETIEVGGRQMSSRAYCSRFNLKGTDQQQKVGVLSGGERNRVHLAKLLKSGGNLLLLDEPSNDLDVATLRSLEDGLINFGGCAVVISHDRWFLDRIATHILSFEEESEVVWFEGNYQAYHAWRQKTLGDKAQPHRVRHRPLHR
ncbi:MAG: energy-dependent translational throttle protein EttA [Verrucomicrobia bacterium]|jgi:energy-dependent translational throttle protein EttA|nr:energy-dependent translational throttle protein EttA [Verrucomicrobiota bacterium]MBT7067342.1 energy-dependent translational throttle protein EttA [Verrucomicrobiota bacterium]MBT7699527.1 energy-dependent translational throttle protein EttA [Verrucomicrobiota bacterium]